MSQHDFRIMENLKTRSSANIQNHSAGTNFVNNCSLAYYIYNSTYQNNVIEISNFKSGFKFVWISNYLEKNKAYLENDVAKENFGIIVESIDRYATNRTMLLISLYYLYTTSRHKNRVHYPVLTGCCIQAHLDFCIQINTGQKQSWADGHFVKLYVMHVCVFIRTLRSKIEPCPDLRVDIRKKANM